MLGVITIVGVLAAMLIPKTLGQLNLAVRQRDAAELSGIVTALQSVIMNTGQIPTATNIPAVVALEMNAPASRISSNSRNLPRTFMVDPNLWIASTNGLLPYTQNGYGTFTNSNGGAPGVNLRMLIISSVGVAIPTNVDFNTTWNTPYQTVPTNWVWKGNVADLTIQRIDLRTLFQNVVLNAIDTNIYGSFAVESGGVASPTNFVVNATNFSNSPFNAYFLRGSVLRLIDTNTGPSQYMLETKAVVLTDTSFVFENMQWRGLLSGWGTNGPAGAGLAAQKASNDFCNFAKAMCARPTNPNIGFGCQNNDCPMAVLQTFYSSMMDYSFWCTPDQCQSAGSDNAWGKLGCDSTSVQQITGKCCY